MYVRVSCVGERQSTEHQVADLPCKKGIPDLALGNETRFDGSFSFGYDFRVHDSGGTDNLSHVFSGRGPVIVLEY